MTELGAVRGSSLAPLRRSLHWAVALLCAALCVIMGAGTVYTQFPDAPRLVLSPVAFVLGAAGLVFPGLVLLLVCSALSLFFALASGDERSRSFRVGLLSAATFLFAWQSGIRIPYSRTAVFTGSYVHHPQDFHQDIFVPTPDSAKPLPFGARLFWGGARAREVKGFPPIAAVFVPPEGWHGSHPRNWPAGARDPDARPTRRLRWRATATTRGGGEGYERRRDDAAAELGDAR